MDRQVVQSAYERLGYCLGWRFMMSPASSFENARLAVIGLNPGGARVHGSDWSFEEGNAYWRESWGGQAPGYDPLQVQVRTLAALAGADEESTFAAQFVPFRSPDWASLEHKAEAVAFAKDLWRWRLSATGLSGDYFASDCVHRQPVPQIVSVKFSTG